MNEFTRVSSKGQVVIPKAIRDKLRWTNGTPLDVIETANGVLLKPRETRRERISVDEFKRRIAPHQGPPITLEQMDEAVTAEARARYVRDYRPK